MAAAGNQNSKQDNNDQLANPGQELRKAVADAAVKALSRITDELQQDINRMNRRG
jgi:hypothetical protein